MATTKTPRTTSTRKAAPRKKAPMPTAPKAAQDDSIAARAGKAIKQRPYTTAAIATGAVAAAAGAYFFTQTEAGKKAGKEIKARASRIRTRAREGAAELRGKAGEVGEKVKDGLMEANQRIKTAARSHAKGDGDAKSQNEIMEEALTLKETARKARHPVDPVAAADMKPGELAH